MVIISNYGYLYGWAGQYGQHITHIKLFWYYNLSRCFEMRDESTKFSKLNILNSIDKRSLWCGKLHHLIFALFLIFVWSWVAI